MMLLRMLVSAVAAAVIVGALLATGVTVFYDRGDPDGVVAHPVQLLSGLKLLEMGDLLGEDWDPNRRRLPDLAPPPPLLPPRTVSGFVQLEFEVGADGRVNDVAIVGATPEGYFEQQARAMVESRTYTPTYTGGRAVPSRRTEVVDFTVPVEPATADPD